LIILREECNLRVFSKILGSERDEETEEWRRLHNEGLNNLYWSTKIVRVIKSRKIRCARHVAHMGKERHIRVFGGETWGKETAWENQALMRG
jgi:hypothetical protein